MNGKEFDMIIFGATGYTGRQALRYLMRLPESELGNLAVAGRDPVKIEALLENATRDNKIKVVIANSSDHESLVDMIARTRVLVNLAGPYSTYGDGCFTACIDHETDYVDLSGESFWIREMIDAHHARAAAGKVKLISLCGYESVPFDIGTLMAVRALQERYDEPCREAEAVIRFSLDDPAIKRDRALSSGTLASARMTIANGSPRSLKDPYFLDPILHSEASLEATPGYRLDSYFDKNRGVWMAPMFPGHFLNPPVVHRSCALWAEHGRGYGANFNYRESVDVSGLAKNAMAQRLVAWVLSLLPRHMLKQIEGKSALNALLTKIMLRGASHTGEGPREDLLDKFRYYIDIVARSASLKEVRVRVTGQGNPGYRSTANMVVEAGLALAHDAARLPGLYGVVTPATGLGLAVIERLKRAGVTFEIG
ncbi:MAG: saccharopine dehydrogenase NADP-binding domain-containing protein [Deltaproteobacteria bacterium]|nr:saccharopine dehydrogenase NADP-binding domain-containing protein [Deltaproteobacteria bacterium]